MEIKEGRNLEKILITEFNMGRITVISPTPIDKMITIKIENHSIPKMDKAIIALTILETDALIELLKEARVKYNN